MDEMWKYIVVYFAGATGIWKGIPSGIAFNLHPGFNGLFTALGSITSVLIIYFVGDSFRQWILSKYGKKRIEKKKNKCIGESKKHRRNSW